MLFEELHLSGANSFVNPVILGVIVFIDILDSALKSYLFMTLELPISWLFLNTQIL